MSDEACVWLMMRPVSSSGTKPFGMILNISTVSPIVASMTSTISQGCRSALRSVRP